MAKKFSTLRAKMSAEAQHDTNKLAETMMHGNATTRVTSNTCVTPIRDGRAIAHSAVSNDYAGTAY